MIEEALVFHCVCGKPGAAPKAEEHGWAQIVGYGAHSTVRWHSSAEAAQANDAPINLLDNPPEPDGDYWLRLEMPFAHQRDEMFWCLYDPPLIQFNGYLDFMDRLDSVRLVACKLIGWERHGDKCVVGHVLVRETVSLVQLAVRPAFPIADDKFFQSFVYGRRAAARRDGLVFLEQDVEGDGGNWLIAREGDTVDVLLFGTWDQHSDYVWAGRGSLSPQLAAQLSMLADES